MGRVPQDGRRYWVMGKSGHGPRSMFKVKIANKTDPITQGLEDFDQDDELYAKLLGDDADQRAGRGGLGLEQARPSRWRSRSPTVRAACSTSALATTAKPSRILRWQRLIQRGTEWAATGKVQ